MVNVMPRLLPATVPSVESLPLEEAVGVAKLTLKGPTVLFETVESEEETLPSTGILKGVPLV